MLPATKPVLCVLSDEQQRHYADGLGALRARGARLIVHTDPEKAFASLELDKPRVVLVGNWVEDMEGLEFLARMLRRFPDYGGRIVILPDQDDPFPPMVHHRPHPGARSEAISTSFGEIAGWLDEPPAGTVPGEAAAASTNVGEEPMPARLPQAGHPGSGKGGRTARVRGRPRGVPVALKVAFPVVVAGGAFGVVSLLYGPGWETPVPPANVALPNAAATVAEPPPASATGAEPSPEAEPTGSGRQRTDAGRLPMPGLPLGELVTLPLLFPKDEAPFSVQDARRLRAIIGALGEALRQDRQSKVEVGGHTSVGASELGLTRAESVKTLLREAGIDNERIIIRNYGRHMPVVKARGDDERNRRVTVRLIHEER